MDANGYTSSCNVSFYDDARTHYTRTVAPAIEPITRDDATRQLQLSTLDDGEYVDTLIAVARDKFENDTGRALITSTWVGVREDWPLADRIEIAVAPVTAVSNIKYYADGATVLSTVSPSDYTVSTLVSPCVITFKDTFTAPLLDDRPDAVQVTFVAGSATQAAIPPTFKHAVRILTRHFYDNPEVVAAGATVNELPMHLRDLLYQARVSGFVA